MANPTFSFRGLSLVAWGVGVGAGYTGGEEFVDPYYFCQSVVFVYFNDQRPFKIPKSYSEHRKLN